MVKQGGNMEDEYFEREDVLRLRALAKKQMEEKAATEREELRKLHWMRCAKCGYELKEILFKGVKIDKCFHCGFVGLDSGELEQLAGQEHDLVSKIAAVFRRSKD